MVLKEGGGRGWGSFWGRSEQDFLEGEMVCLLGIVVRKGLIIAGC